MNRVCGAFIKGVTIQDKAFARLEKKQAVNFYRYFLDVNRRLDLASLISSQVKHWQERKRSDEPYMYVGSTYGEEFGTYGEARGKVYIDLRKKSTPELVNLLIVKTKIEQEFVSFQYNDDDVGVKSPLVP